MAISKVLKGTLAVSSYALMVGCGPNDDNITAASSGEEVYAQTCAGCHSGGVKGFLTAAPEVGDKDVWKPLLAKGVDELTNLSIKGFEKMPAKGACGKCSDEQIRAAVEIMVARSQQ